MLHHLLIILGAALPPLLSAATAGNGESNGTPDHGPYARIAFLRPRDGNTVDFEAGYIRHLEWHRQAKDPFVWYGYTVSAGERQRWLVYATFGHAAASFDAAPSPAEDERDNVTNVMPHAEFAGGGFYQFVPQLSTGSATGVPEPAARAELLTVDLLPGSEDAFERALRAAQTAANGEVLWYRMLAGGPTPRYVRLRPRRSWAAILELGAERPLPDSARPLVAKTTVEILSLRPTMSYNLPN